MSSVAKSNNVKPLRMTDVVLRDAHQSLLATRMRIEDMLPIAKKLDKVGYWSVESWGGATFDSCIRYLGEDPWERLRQLKAAMPKTKQQMLLRGQNLLGYRHYADDVVDKFVERAAENGMDVFRIFDAMNDIRNLERAVAATIGCERHAQGTMSYTVSPVHTMDMWVDMGRELEDMGCHSICIKDMAGLLRPYTAFELVSRLKKHCSIPITMHCHATTGLSTATIVKAVEAGLDMVDASISSMSMTYGHSAMESVVAIFEGTKRDTGLDLHQLEDIAAYFRDVRLKYASFEGALRGVDSRILTAQVPGGMLTNLESQLREQNAGDKLDEVLQEIPRVRKDLGYIPLVTPTSQIVGTQAVINVLTGERYKSITKETAGVLKGEYGATCAPVNAALQMQVLEGDKPIKVRPADLLKPEMEDLVEEFMENAKDRKITIVDEVDDALIYALFPQIGLKYLENRENPDAFEPAPDSLDARGAPVAGDAATYNIDVDGKAYHVVVNAAGEMTHAAAGAAVGGAPAAAPVAAAPAASGETIVAPLAGNVFKLVAAPGTQVAEDDLIMIVEAMKMETEVRAPRAGQVVNFIAQVGDAVQVGDPLYVLA